MYTRRNSDRQNKKEPLLKRKDVILIADCLILALMSMFVRKMDAPPRTDSSMQVVVYVGEEETARYPLNGEITAKLTGREGETNDLEIREGKADVVSASCPDKICVRQNPISEIGETIVCLPNQVIVTIEAAE